jgi:hypothetical protein
LFGLAMIEAMRKGTPVDAFAATVIRRDPAGRGHHLPRRAALGDAYRGGVWARQANGRQLQAMGGNTFPGVPRSGCGTTRT